MNRCFFIGRLIFDPELKQTSRGTSYTRIGIAVPNRKKVGDDWIEDADFIYLTVWARQAEAVCKYQKKGSQVAVEAHLEAGNREDGQGNRKYFMSLTADKVHFLGGGKKREEEEEPVFEEEFPPF